MSDDAPASIGRAEPSFLRVGTGDSERRIAYRGGHGGDPLIFWLGGYRSDMLGAKAERLASAALRSGLAYGRFDYSGHGESGGRFEDGTISRWTEEAEAVLAALPSRRVILVGSSMGAWIALRIAQRLAGGKAEPRVEGLLLIAPAPDFTRRLVGPSLTPEQRHDLETIGFCREPSLYSAEPTIYTRVLMEDGERNLVMEDLIETGCPVRILQGVSDDTVPFRHALDLVSLLPAQGVVLTLVRDGDHRLSREDDLVRIESALIELLREAAVTSGAQE